MGTCGGAGAGRLASQVDCPRGGIYLFVASTRADQMPVTRHSWRMEPAPLSIWTSLTATRRSSRLYCRRYERPSDRAGGWQSAMCFPTDLGPSLGGRHRACRPVLPGRSHPPPSLGRGRIDIRHVYVQKRSGGLAETTAVTDHDDGIADPHFRGSAGLEFTLRTEDRLQERDKIFRVPDDDPGRNGMPSVRLKFGHAVRLRTIV